MMWMFILRGPGRRSLALAEGLGVPPALSALSRVDPAGRDGLSVLPARSERGRR